MVDGLGRDMQLGADAAVGQAGRQAAQDLELAHREAERIAARRRARPARDVADARTAQALAQHRRRRRGAEPGEDLERLDLRRRDRRRRARAPARRGSRAAAIPPPRAASGRGSAAGTAAPATTARPSASRRPGPSRSARQRTRTLAALIARPQAARRLGDGALAVAGEPCRLGARGAHRRQPLQRVGLRRPAPAPRRAPAAASTSPRRACTRPSATSADDAADRRHARPRQQIGRDRPPPRSSGPGRAASAPARRACSGWPNRGRARRCRPCPRRDGVRRRPGDRSRRRTRRCWCGRCRPAHPCPGRRRARCCAGDGRGRSRRRSPAARCRSHFRRRRRWRCRRSARRARSPAGRVRSRAAQSRSSIMRCAWMR